jgi:hypothetical protein
MGLSANLHGVGGTYRLCFIRVPWAFFTRLPLDCQWGDRWEVTPSPFKVFLKMFRCEQV